MNKELQVLQGPKLLKQDTFKLGILFAQLDLSNNSGALIQLVAL